jgi:WD40 repeat protein
MGTRFWKMTAVADWTFLLTSVLSLVSPAGAQQFSDWSVPINLGSRVNSDASEQTPVISKDGLSLYFGSDRAGGFGGIDIWVAQRLSVDDPWETPINLGSNINTSGTENAPALSPDGHWLFFQSTRPGGFGANDIYASRRHDRRDDLGWEPPQNLGSGVNTSFNERGAEYFEDPETGTVTLYFNSDRPGGMGGNDIYASTLQQDGTFGPAALVVELSSPDDDQALAIRRDGLEVIIASNRLGTLGGLDLWVATRASTSDPWSMPIHLGPVLNSTAAEAGVALSHKGTALYFHSGRPGGFGAFDIYVSTRSKLKEPDDGEDEDHK